MLTDEEFDTYWFVYCRRVPTEAKRISAFVYEYGDLVLDGFNAYMRDRIGDYIAFSTFIDVMVYKKLINLGSLQARIDLENFIEAYRD